MKKIEFYTKLPFAYKVLIYILMAIYSLLTLGLSRALDDFYFDNRSWLNRRVLHRFLQKENIKLVEEDVFGSLLKYEIDGLDFRLFVDKEKLELGLYKDSESFLIDNHVRTKREDMFSINIIRKLHKLYKAQ